MHRADGRGSSRSVPKDGLTNRGSPGPNPGGGDQAGESEKGSHSLTLSAQEDKPQQQCRRLTSFPTAFSYRHGVWLPARSLLITAGVWTCPSEITIRKMLYGRNS